MGLKISHLKKEERTGYPAVNAFLERLCNFQKDAYTNKKTSYSPEISTLHGIFVHSILARLARGDSPKQLSYNRILSSDIPSEVQDVGPDVALSAFEDAKQVCLQIFPRLLEKYEFIHVNYLVRSLGLVGSIDAICRDKSTGKIVVVEWKTSLHENYQGTRNRSKIQAICYCMMLHENSGAQHEHVPTPEAAHIISINWSPKSKKPIADHFSYATATIHTERIGYNGKECRDLKTRITTGLYNFGHLSLSFSDEIRQFNEVYA